MSEIHMNVTVDFSLLNANLAGAAEKNENGVEFFGNASAEWCICFVAR